MEGKDNKPLTQDSLKELAAKKEEEWRQIQQLRAETLEGALKQKDKDLQDLKAQFVKLKEDFKYNLRLLGERDGELDHYDSVVSGLRTQLAQKDAEMSDSRIKLDELSCALTQETRAREELQVHYQQRVRERQAEVDQYRCAKDAEFHKERQDLESFKRNLERQLREAEEEMEIQRRELTAGFEEAMRKREHEFRVQSDEMSATVLAHEMKVKLLTKELELVRGSQQSTAVEFEQVEGAQRQLEKQLKQKQWQLDDVKAMAEAKMKELNNKLQHAEDSKKKMNDDFKRKYEDLDRQLKDKESTVTKLRDSLQTQTARHQQASRAAQSQLEDAQVKLRQATWAVQDATKDRDATRERLEAELADLKLRWERHVTETSHCNVQRDVELEALRERDTQYNTEMAQRKQDIERYKRELSLAADRESALEREKTQLDLDWQRRYDGVERDQYEKSESLVTRLTNARDEAVAEAKERTRELSQREEVIRLLTRDRDTATATLRQHGLTADRDVDLTKWQPAGSDSDLVLRLEEQNDNLRGVIRHMREEMEALGRNTGTARGHDAGTDARGAGRGPGTAANEYVRNLEEELKKLKAENRRLQSLTQSPDSCPEPGGDNVTAGGAGDNAFVRAHVEQLNNTIGSLRSEKVELTAQLRKQQARLHHLESGLEKALTQPREKQAQVEQLQYELNAATRRHDAEVTSLRARVSEMELQLAETRKEADEYHRANVERNLDVTGLNNQISQLKMQMAQDRPAVNFGAQELMIQQLQDEIQHLRQLQKGEDPIASINTFDPKLGQGQGHGTNALVSQLQQKLRTAAKHITQLAKEKQQLIEMGNRLRAQLKNNGLQSVSAVSRQESARLDSTGSSVLQDKINNKLQQLEQLQYELTKQELASKQTKSHHNDPVVPRMRLPVSSTEDEDTNEDEDRDYQPQSILKKSSAGGSAAVTKLSPVPEDNVHHSRPRTAPEPQTYHPHHPHSSSPGGPRDGPPHPRDAAYAAVMASMSSVGGESLQEIWRMLDEEGTSPRPFTPLGTGEFSGSGPFQGLQFPGESSSTNNNKNSQQRPKSADSWRVKGQTPTLEPKPKAQTKIMSNKVSGKVIAKKNKSKVRNWNVKDS